MKTKIENVRLSRHWIIFYVIAFVCVIGAFFCDAAVSALHATKSLRDAMTWVSKIGDWPGHVVLGLILLGVAWLRKNKTWLRIFLAMLIACAVAGIAARAVKIAVGRPRPSVKSEQAVDHTARFQAKYQSFPSGHTASSTAFFVALFLSRRRLGAPFLLVPAVIAFSRMIVGAHYLSDVTFAAILGIVIAAIVTRLIGTEAEQPPGYSPTAEPASSL